MREQLIKEFRHAQGDTFQKHKANVEVYLH